MMSSRVCVAIALSLLHQTATAQATLTRPISLELTIGENATSDEYIFGRISYVAASPDGRIYVLDVKSCEGRMYSAAGKFEKLFGVRGGGPGELQCPGSGLEVRGSKLYAEDVLSGRIAEYTLDGNHVATTQAYRRTPGGPSMRVNTLRHGSELTHRAAFIGSSSGVPKDRFGTLSVRGPGGGRVAQLGRFLSHMACVSPTSNRSYVVFTGSGFGGGGAWAVLHDSLVAIADGYTGSVTWMLETPAGLRTVRHDTITGAGRRVTQADLEALAARFKKTELTGRFGSGVQVVASPTQWSVAHRALFAQDGTLWVGGVPQNGSTTWTAFPPSAPKFAVQVPGDFWLDDVVNGKLYGYANDTDAGPVVRVYKLQ